MLHVRIKELRLSYGMNQVEFGKRLNVTKQSISNWENNNIQPSIDMLVKIAHVFSVSTDYLLGLDDRQTLDATGLSAAQTAHLQSIIDDLRKADEQRRGD